MSELWKKLYALEPMFKTGRVAKSGNIVTPIARASFVELFKPKRNSEKPDAEPKYAITLLFPPEADLTLLKNAVREAVIERWGADESQWPHRIDENNQRISLLRLPFRDQGEKAFEGYVRGCKFVNLSTVQKPGVLNQNGEHIIDETKLYSGCWVWATVNAFAYPKQGAKDMGNKGVSLGLTNVQLISDDDRLGGRPRAESEFEPVKVPTAAAAASTGAGSIFDT